MTIGYAVTALVALALGYALVRRTGGGTAGVADEELNPYQVAYQLGGPATAVMAAVAALHARKSAMSLPGGRLAATGESPTTRVKPLEYAVLRALRHPTTLGALRSAPVVRGELDTIDRHLVTRGLVPPAVRRRLLRGTAGLLGAVAVVGLVFVLAVPGVAATAVVAGYLVLAVPLLRPLRRRVRRTAAGDALLADLRDRRPDLDPARQDAWRPRPPEDAATAVALYGPAAMPPGTARRSGSWHGSAVDGSAAGG